MTAPDADELAGEGSPFINTTQVAFESPPWIRLLAFIRGPRVRAALPVAALSFASTLGFGLSFFGNSASSHWLGPGISERWIALFLRCVGNAIGTAAILPFLMKSRLRGGATDHPYTLVLNSQFGLTVVSSMLSTSAYVPFGALTDASGEVSVLTGMAGLHGVVPAIWGLLFWGETHTLSKVVGIGLSAAAVLSLGLGDAKSVVGPDHLSLAGAAYKISCFCAAVILWGAADLLNTATVIDSASASVALFVGNLIAAMAFGCLHLLSPPPPPPPPPLAMAASGVERMHVWGTLVILAANICGILGRLAFIRLGQVGQASSFAPVVALYVYVPVILSAIFLGERISASKVLGCVLGGAAVLLLSASWGGRRLPGPSANQRLQTGLSESPQGIHTECD